MRYLRLVLSTAINHPEFQRQIAAPAVPKIGAAMISITENLVDTDMMVLLYDPFVTSTLMVFRR